MTITYHPDLVQGGDEWLAARCGLLTASEMHLIVTPTLKIAANDKEKRHLWELLSQRITKYVEPHYVSDDMLRGTEDEIDARILYATNYAPVQDMGFITNNKWGFTIGYSPDAMVGDDGLIECKSRRQGLQVETIVKHMADGTIPPEHSIQVQTGLLVSERKYCDYVSYSGGLPMATIRVYPMPEVQDAIIAAARAFEERLVEKLVSYHSMLEQRGASLIPTERKIEMEMHL